MGYEIWGMRDGETTCVGRQAAKNRRDCGRGVPAPIRANLDRGPSTTLRASSTPLNPEP